MNRNNNIFKSLYGMDCLSLFLLLLCGLLNLITLIYPKGVCNYACILGIIPLGFSIYRFFSRNLSARWEENHFFLQIVDTVFQKDPARIEQKKQDKNFKFFDCPDCKLQIRIPKGKGRIEITCPKCERKFIKKT